jgi:hypothetical protein
MFKPGDKIICLRSSADISKRNPAYVKGQIYQVKNFHNGEGGGTVETVVDSRGSTSNGWGAANFKLVSNKKIKNLPNWW